MLRFSEAMSNLQADLDKFKLMEFVLNIIYSWPQVYTIDRVTPGGP